MLKVDEYCDWRTSQLTCPSKDILLILDYIAAALITVMMFSHAKVMYLVLKKNNTLNSLSDNQKAIFVLFASRIGYATTFYLLISQFYIKDQDVINVAISISEFLIIASQILGLLATSFMALATIKSSITVYESYMRLLMKRMTVIFIVLYAISSFVGISSGIYMCFIADTALYLYMRRFTNISVGTGSFLTSAIILVFTPLLLNKVEEIHRLAKGNYKTHQTTIELVEQGVSEIEITDTLHGRLKTIAKRLYSIPFIYIPAAISGIITPFLNEIYWNNSLYLIIQFVLNFILLMSAIQLTVMEEMEKLQPKKRILNAKTMVTMDAVSNKSGKIK